MTKPLPPFVVDYDYLVAATNAASDGIRRLSRETIHMALAALSDMKYNRYWRSGENYLNQTQQIHRNDMVDNAIVELMAEIETGTENTTPPPHPTYPPGGEGGEIEENDMHIIYLPDGNAYLTDNTCGCPTRFFRLTGAQVSVGEGGGVVIPDEGDTIAEPSFPAVPDYLSCYAGKAVPYLLARAIEFHASLDTIIETGVDFLGGTFDEFFDLASIVLDLVGGETDSTLDILRQFSNEDLSDILTDSTFVQTMTDAWIYDGPVSRVDLFNWTANAPVNQENIGVRGLLRQWVYFSTISGYNTDLRRFARECETGADVDDVTGQGEPQADGSTKHTVTTDDGTYEIYEYTPNEELEYGVGPESYWEAPELKDNMIGVGSHCRPIGASNMVVWATVQNTIEAANEETVGTGSYYSLASSRADAATALSELTGQTYYRYNGTASAAMPNGGVKCAYSYAGGTVMLDNLYIVCEVP